MSVPQHIVDHLEDYLDGKLDAAGQSELLRWAGDSNVNAKELAAWFRHEVEILESARVADMCDVLASLPFDARTNESNHTPKHLSNRAWFTSGRWVPIAAAVLIALVGSYLFWSRTITQQANAGASNNASAAENEAPDEPTPSPAILARLANCVWAADMQALRVGQDIVAGTTVDIQSGLAQIVFESGAKVVLRGPCKLRVDDSMLCQLAYGSVSADVPPRAAGFTIRGPSSEVIDLGTRFGFSVGGAGKSEVHVFQGEVISRQLDERGDVVGKDIRLKKNQAILFPGERKQAQRLAANEAKFAIEVRPLWKQDQIESLAVDRKLALWLRAEHGVQKDRRGHVIAWQDLALGDNRISNDAFQPDYLARPKFVQDGINGRPAIRFDGASSYLTTTPMTTTDDQTIVAAFQYLPPRDAGDRIGGQIINYNGPPSRFLPDIHRPGVLQLGEKVDVWNGPEWSISAKVFVGRDSRGNDVSAGIAVSEPIGPRTPVVVAYAYSNSEDSATLYINGKRVARASAPTSVEVTSRKVIGKHGIFDQWYFCGDLGELLIYDTALNPKEVGELSQQLMDYYKVGNNDTKQTAL